MQDSPPTSVGILVIGARSVPCKTEDDGTIRAVLNVGYYLNLWVKLRTCHHTLQPRPTAQQPCCTPTQRNEHNDPSQLDKRTNLLVILLGGDKLCLGLDRLDSSSTVLASDEVVSDTNGRYTSETEVKCSVVPRLGLGRLSGWRGCRVLAVKGGTGESLASRCATKRRSGAEGGAEGVEGHVVVVVVVQLETDTRG